MKTQKTHEVRLSRLEKVLASVEGRILTQLATTNSISDNYLARYLRVKDAYHEERKYAA